MAKAQAETVTQAGETKRPSKAAAEGVKPKMDADGNPVEGNTGAPRPRKWNYGISNENTVNVVKRTEEEGEPKLKAQEAEGYAMAVKGPTVEAFLVDSDRGILRRLSRKGLINVTGKDGTVYPIEYVAPPKPAKAEKQEAGTKAA
jgi:hypothetical protein